MQQYNFNVEIVEPREGTVLEPLKSLTEYEPAKRFAEEYLSGKRHINAAGDWFEVHLMHMPVVGVQVPVAQNLTKLLDAEAILSGEVELDPENPVSIAIYYEGGREDWISPSKFGGLCVHFGPN